jgi:hypothetical protein
MIPRFQRIVYWTLVSLILLMGVTLVVSRQRDHERILAMRDQSAIPAPTDIPNEQASLAIPNDADDSIALDQKSLALPPDPSTRARVLLASLLANLALPASTHPVPPGPAITDVFFLALPIKNPAAPITDQYVPASTSLSSAQLAVVNLTEAFADAHLSGIEAEDLTLRAIISTLHANFPQIAQVRFLVAGQPRNTLAGHADLAHPYSVADPIHSIHTVSPNTVVRSIP